MTDRSRGLRFWESVESGIAYGGQREIDARWPAADTERPEFENRG